MKSFIEIDTDDIHDLSMLEGIVSGYLRKKNIPFTVVVASKRFSIVESG